MQFIEGHFNVKLNGEIVNTFILMNKGGNHGVITNNAGVLFDGYILEGYKIWEKKLADQMKLMNFCNANGLGKNEIELIK